MTTTTTTIAGGSRGAARLRLAAAVVLFALMGSGLLAGFVQHETGDLPDQAVFFSQWNKANGGNAPELGRVPTHQCLEAAGPAADIDFRLIDDVQFVAIDG